MSNKNKNISINTINSTNKNTNTNKSINNKVTSNNKRGIKTGRPNKYFTHIQPNLDKIKDLKIKGVSDEDIAKIIGVSRRTYLEHKAVIDEFSHIYKSANEKIMEFAEESLYKLVKGEAKKTRVTTVYNDTGEIITRTVLEEQLPPDNTSVFFTLVNVSDGKWKHRQHVVMHDDTNDDIEDSHEEVMAREMAKNESD